MQILVNGVDVTASYTREELADITLEFAGFNAEIGQGSIPAPSAPGLAVRTGQSLKILGAGGHTVFDGFVAARTRERGDGAARGRILNRLTAADSNALLYGFVAENWVRPAETDRARVLAFAAAFCPLLTTGSVLNTNLVNLPAKTYTTDDLTSELLTDIVPRVNKTMFVEGRALHFHKVNEGTAATVSIHDTTYSSAAAILAGTATVFPPANPVRTFDGGLGLDIRVRNAAGAVARAFDAAAIAIHDAAGLKHQRLITADADAADLRTIADQYLAALKTERATYACLIGPLTSQQLATVIGPGRLITVTSEVLGLTASSQRIAKLTARYVWPDRWWVDVEMAYPLRMPGTGSGAADGLETGGGIGSPSGADPFGGCGCEQDCSDCATPYADVDNADCDVIDDFNRTVAAGANLGTASSGGTWSFGSGDASGASVDGSRGSYLDSSWTGTQGFRQNLAVATQREFTGIVKVKFRLNYDFQALELVDADSYVSAGTSISIDQGVDGTPQLVSVTVSQWKKGAGQPSNPQGPLRIRVHVEPNVDVVVDGGRYLDADTDYELWVNLSERYAELPALGLRTPANPQAIPAGQKYTRMTLSATFDSSDGSGGIGIVPPGGTGPQWKFDDLRHCTVIPPRAGQPVTSSSTTDGTTSHTTDWPYIAGTLRVSVNGVPWGADAIEETNPETGSYRFLYALPDGAEIVESYNAA